MSDRFDVLIVGGGPAGAIAGLVAARAGARVRILERARFPRDKLCGDTLNPGALAILRRLGIAASIDARGLRVDGMTVSGENGITINGRYPGELHGRAIVRRELDAALLDAAALAGCAIEQGVVVRRAVVVEDRAVRDGQRVAGVVVTSANAPRRERRLTAPVIIGADGRRSALAFGLGLVRHPPRPRRWAVGAYFGGVARPHPIPYRTEGPTPYPTRYRTKGPIPYLTPDPTPLTPDPTPYLIQDQIPDQIPDRIPDRTLVAESAVFGEMHIRRNCYIGIAPVPGGLTNVCLVREATAGDADFRDPAVLVQECIRRDPLLRDRFVSASLATPPVVLGPLAVDPSGGSFDGLLLAGDASGFIDPMTGDGLRFAIRGGELAADAALRVLANGWHGAHAAFAQARAEAFARKWRFNRMLRALVASPHAVSAAAAGARLAPGILRAIVARAGDCHLAA